MDDFKKIAVSVKRQLASNESKIRTRTISDLLEILRKNDSEQFVMELVYKGVISDLLRNFHPENRRNILKCIEIIVERNAFYTNDLIDEVIKGIKTRRLTEDVEETASVVKILDKIITKVFEFREIEGIYLIKKQQDVLLDLITHAYFDSFSCVSVSTLLNFIIGYSTIDFKQTQISRIKSSYSLIMEFLMKSQDISALKKIEIICCTTILLANFCNEIEDDELNTKISAASSGESSVHQRPSVKQEIIKSIRKSTIKYVIPFAKVWNKLLKMDVETASNLVQLLKTVIKLREVKDANLCVELLDNGYLKYLLELSLLYSKKQSFRISVCRLISEVIVTLREYLELPIDDSPKGLATFQDFLCTGFASLPTDINEWNDLLKYNDKKSNSLLILLFCHYIGTDEMYIFSQKSVAIKLQNFDAKYKEPIIFRALWLLYSVAALNFKNSNTSSDPYLYTKAIQRLQTLLQKENKIELVYTHIEDVLLFSMKEFPEKLRIKVIGLWLDNSESEREFDTFIKECLVQGYDELTIVKIIMRLVHRNCMANLDNAVNAFRSLLRFREVITDDVVEFIWKTLSEDLFIYTSSNSDILKTVLRFVSALPTSESCSIRALRKCAIGIGKIVITENTDLIMKTLLINAAAFVMRQSEKMNDYKVVDIFLKNGAFLKEVYKSGMSFCKIALTNICIRVLTCLIAYQIKYDIQSDTVAELTFQDLDALLLNLREQNCFTIFGIELIQFLMKSNIQNPVIKLRKLENESDVQNIYNVYFLIHSVHAETSPGEEDQTYKCLSTMLSYCSAQNLNMGIFLMCPATPLLIELAVTGFSMSNRLSYYFLHFSATWLCYLKDYRSKTELQYESIPEESVKLLIQIPLILKLDEDDDPSVKPFLIAVSYFKQSKE